MTNRNNNTGASGNGRAETVNALSSYFADCRFDQSHLTPMHLALALEYAYRPHPRFWREFDVTVLIDAISQHVPHWRSTPAMSNGGADKLFRSVKKNLRINAFDEANGEMLLAVPGEERPTTSSAAYAWISAELEKKGLAAQLEFARPDGERCGEKALDVLYCLEQAKLGIAIERTGTIVAKAYHDAVIKHHAQRAKSAVDVLPPA
jgi:hypothetical protein